MFPVLESNGLMKKRPCMLFSAISPLLQTRCFMGASYVCYVDFAVVSYFFLQSHHLQGSICLLWAVFGSVILVGECGDALRLS